jgi:hypothetical protein
VDPDEIGASAASLIEVAKTGDQAKQLAALRDLLARELVGSEGRGVAALAREYRDTIRELSTISAPEVDEVDELKSRRARRRDEAASS